jgi:hypothetical protein
MVSVYFELFVSVCRYSGMQEMMYWEYAVDLTRKIEREIY